jgi:hypothetical protein
MAIRRTASMARKPKPTIAAIIRVRITGLMSHTSADPGTCADPPPVLADFSDLSMISAHELNICAQSHGETLRGGARK